MSTTPNNLASYIWSLADLLRAAGGLSCFNTSRMDLSKLAEAFRYTIP